MIEYAGIGIAVKNATPGARTAADYITEENDQNGVSVALHNLGLT